MPLPRNANVRVANEPQDLNLDPFGGTGATWRGKIILPLDGPKSVTTQLDSGEVIKASNGVITYTFLDKAFLTGLYNNPTIGFTAAFGLSPYSAEQQAAARAAIQLWDDLIPQSFRETNGRGADISFSNSLDPAQAYAYYPGKQGWKFQSDVFTADPNIPDSQGGNWTNKWFTPGGYGTTTLVHELGHAIGLSHPGAYNYDPNVPQTYDGLAEYAQDTNQYSIMSYWSSSFTGARTINWSTLTNNNAQTPMLHDIYVIQQKYGADLTTRTGDTVYGFGTNTGNAIYDFAKNPFPYLSIYDAKGNDTINASGFSVSQFIDLHAGSFSSIGGAVPDAATINAARAELSKLAGYDVGSVTAASASATATSFINANTASIKADTGVDGIAATEYQNFSIAYGVTIENAIGGSARDLIWGNSSANKLEGRGGNDVINGFGGADQLLGGAGNDTFEFSVVDKLSRIVDWNAGDKIDLKKIDAIAGGADNAFTWIGDGNFTKVAGQLHYKGGVLEGDVNGDGVADFAITLVGSPLLGVGDLTL